MVVVAVAKVDSAVRGSRSIPRELWIGLTTPTIGGWLGSLCFAVAEFWFLCLFLSPKTLAEIEPRYLMESSRDDYARVSLALARLHASSSKSPQVVYTGSSQAKWALTSWRDDLLSRDLSRRAGFKVDFHDCTSDLQHYEDTLFVIDQLPQTFRGLVVVAIDDHRDSRADVRRFKHERWIGDSAPDYEEAQGVRGVPHDHTGIFFLDHLGFFASRRIAAVRIGFPFDNPYPNQLGFRDGDREKKKMKRDLKVRLATKWRGPPPALTNAAPLLVAITDRLQARGIPVVFFDPPRNPLRLEVEAERVDAYDTEIPLVIEGLGAEYWQFDQELDLQPDDFSDAVHVKSEAARKKFQGTLFDRIASRLAGAGLGRVEHSTREEEDAP
jgi:hypothetical protein